MAHNPTHGTASTYRSGVYRCRCDDCRIAHTKRLAEEREIRRLRLLADPSLAPHGRVSTYTNWKCRCKKCSYANSARCQRDYYAKKNRAA